MNGGRWLALVLALPAGLQAQNRTVAELRRTMRCEDRRVGSGVQRDCEYQAGRSLRFAIAGVGQSDGAITVYHSDMDDDYYVSVGMQHGCAIVHPTRIAKDRDVIRDMAFVSPFNGRVYDTWQACDRSRVR